LLFWLDKSLIRTVGISPAYVSVRRQLAFVAINRAKAPLRHLRGDLTDGEFYPILCHENQKQMVLPNPRRPPWVERRLIAPGRENVAHCCDSWDGAFLQRRQFKFLDFAERSLSKRDSASSSDSDSSSFKSFWRSVSIVLLSCCLDARQ
jgi:hypothetical protein